MPKPLLTKVLRLLTTLVVGCISLSAQKSSTLVNTDPVQQYQLVQATMEQFYARGLVKRPSNIARGLVNSTIDRKSASYDLWNCVESTDYLGFVDDKEPGSGALDKLLNLALTTVVWRSDFKKLGVPEEVWGSLVSSYESMALKQGGVFRDNQQDEAPRKQIAAALNKYRQQANPRLPKFIVEGGCGGGGEIEVHIKLLPADGQLFLIPVFLYKLCQAQHLIAADPRSCDRWTEVINGTASYVSGDYLYLARWTDGSVRCGPLGFKSFDQEGKTFQITKLRSPECNPGW